MPLQVYGIFGAQTRSLYILKPGYLIQTLNLYCYTPARRAAYRQKQLRYIIRAWWPDTWISNEELHRRCQQRPIETEIRERRWKWIGHTLRRGANEICREALDWNPQGQRRRGRPRGSWRRSLANDIQTVDGNLSWRQVKAIAGNRQQWRGLISSLCRADNTADQDH